MNRLPKISSYGEYDSSNYGAHALKVSFENFDLFYSYETIVAFSEIGKGITCSKNVWSTTTGKHLNWIESDKKNRLDHEEFTKLLEEMLERRTK